MTGQSRKICSRLTTLILNFIIFFQKRWEALIRRALCRASGQEPPKRGKHWKSKQNSTETAENSESIAETTTKNSESLILDNLKYDTIFVDTQTNIKELFAAHFENCANNDEKSANCANEDEKSSKFGLIGLHTCGNLAPSSLQIFLASKDFKFCCNVGCCYHFLEEEFYANPYTKSGCDSENSQKFGFPMSNILRDQNFWIGRNARMVAAQPMDRSISNKQVSSDFYRFFPFSFLTKV